MVGHDARSSAPREALDKSSIIPYKWVMISSILHTAYIAAIFITAVCLVFPRARLPLLLFLCGVMMYLN